MLFFPPQLADPTRARPRGAHPCEGCAKKISATRRWCLRCVAEIVKENLERRGSPVSKAEVHRALMEEF
jgi:predicted amidophosphoribosyltransferase